MMGCAARHRGRAMDSHRRALRTRKRFDKAVARLIAAGVRAVGGDGLVSPADTSEPKTGKQGRTNILMQPFGNPRDDVLSSEHGRYPPNSWSKKWDRPQRPTREGKSTSSMNMTALTLDTIGLCGFDYRFNSFLSAVDYHTVRGNRWCARFETHHDDPPASRLERAVAARRSAARIWRRDVRPSMNKMVDEIHRRAARGNAEAPAEGPRKDMLGGHAGPAVRDRATGEATRRRQHPLPDQHLPGSRGMKTNQRSVCRARFNAAAQASRCAEEAYGGSRPGARAPDIDARHDLSAGHAAHLYYAGY